MARRFGGKYSPTDVPPAGSRPVGRDWTGRRPVPSGARLNALFLAPAPLVLRAFGRDPVGLALNLAAFGILMGAAYLTREGVRAQEAYDGRRVARRPALPRKILGSLLTGAGLAVAAAANPIAAAIFFVLGTALHFLSFGADPLRDKGQDIDRAQADRVARVVDEGEAHLRDMIAAAERTGDRTVIDRAHAFAATARTMFRTVEDDPRDLTGARRWLGVYLQGARDATVKYADLVAARPDAPARAAYLSLLDDLETGFATRTQKMLTEDRGDLEIEIEVLRDRLDREEINARRDA
ncbi:hypothetical protein OCGS_0555 [Oceaniovalibus guishaninsula JLT2003]|uniref:5-bromo-4-chloroindolyl phosphate hydrolysis protein n=1 Tax=Oceaniovalibus guishaninsula JLT2003 TaxID=1231392 RepID=K2I8X6_9RHOB|nr:5-bromo-4-chloroindolyl phosphate hydrolysis family protein [Oceaniovalibus guishaninsula]EKE45465.1 hypothetical protein OCGS_0555 [Oceaniovalibus guishaninsula JLT2003]